MTGHPFCKLVWENQYHLRKETPVGDLVMKIDEIKRRARKNMEDGAVTQGYRADRTKVLKLLNDSLATEIVCVLRYQRHYRMASGIHSESVAAEFLEHSKEEMQHVDWLAERIVQLGGEPDYNPATLMNRAHTDYVECDSLLEMIQEDLVAERIVIELYGEMIRFVGNDDPTTRRVFEKILADEEEHAEDLASLLVQMNAGSTRDRRSKDATHSAA